MNGKGRRRVELLVAGVALLLGCPPPVAAPQHDSVLEASPRLETDVRTPPEVPPSTVDGHTPPVVLLMTDPTPARVQDLVSLVRQRILFLPGLRVVGLFPESARSAFDPTRALLKEQRLGWIELQGIDCEVSSEEILASNPCVESFARLVDGSDGLLLSGGPDIPPAQYGEESLLTTVIRDPLRNALEVSLLFHLLGDPIRGSAALLEERPAYFVLGICLGMQTMNVALGGTLVQDIPSELYSARTMEAVLALPADAQHRSYEARLRPLSRAPYWTVHSLRVRARWPFGPSAEQETTAYRVMSAHHQAVERLGRDLLPLATSSDGRVVEALGHRRFPNVIGVQFHPEYKEIYDVDPGIQAGTSVRSSDRPNDPEMRIWHVRLWRVLTERLRVSASQRTGATR